jgi:hypothetical protein
MNLIEKVKDYQTYGDFVTTTDEMNSMLEVLSMFRGGDVACLHAIHDILISHGCKDGSIVMDCLERMRCMAAMMEETR